MKVRLLTALLSLVTYNVFSQLIVTDFIPPERNAMELNICGDPSTFTLEVSGDSIWNVELSLDLTNAGMMGIEYIPGSFSPAPTSEDASDPTQPVFNLDLINGTATFTFDARVNCDFIDFLNGAGQAFAQFDFTYTERYDTVTMSFPTGTPLSYVNSPEFNNSISIPNIIVGGPNTVNASYIASVLGETYTREIAVWNTGLTSALDTLRALITYGPGLSVANQMINGTAIAPGDLTFIGVNGAGESEYLLEIGDFSTYASAGPGNLDGDAFFELETNNQADAENFIFSEEVTLVECESYVTTWEASYGCDGADCYMEESVFGAALSTNPANLSVSAVGRVFPDCLEDGAVHTFDITNNGPGYATNVFFQIQANNSSWTALDAGSITYQINGGVVESFDVNEITNVANLPAGNCHSGTPDYYQRVDTDSLAFLAPGDVVRVSYTTYQCCTESCGATPGYFGSIIRTRQFLPCSNSVITGATRSFGEVNFNTTSASSTPNTMTLGDTETFSYDLISYDADIPQIHDKAEYCIDFNIPANLQYNPNSPIEWVAGNVGGITLSPASVEVGGAALNPGDPPVNGPATVTACFGDGFGTSVGRFRNSQLKIDYTYYNCTCGTNVTSSADMVFIYDGPTCTDPCELNILCESDITALASGGCCGSCDGLINLEYSVERTCVGEPDNNEDGCPDAGGMLDLTAIRLDRVMKGDEMRFTTTGLVSLTGGTMDSIHYIYFENDFTSFGDRVLMPVGGNEVMIQDASTGMTYTCSDIASVNDGLASRWDLSAPMIQGCGTVPANFTFEDNDIITLSGNVVYTDNVGCAIENVYLETCFYGATYAAPVAGGDRIKCSASLPAAFEGVGYSFGQINWTRSFTGCGYVNGLRSDFCIGGGNEGTNPFPYEYRHWSHITESRMAMPPGYLINRVRYATNNTRATNATNYYDEDRTDLVQIVNDTFVSNFLLAYDTCGTTPQIPYSDDANEGRSMFFYDVPCTIELGMPVNAYHEITRVVQFCSPFFEDEYHTFSSVHNYTPTGPDISLATPLDLSEPGGKTGSWQVLLNNAGGQAKNGFLVVVAPPSLSPGTLTLGGGGTATEVNGIYQLGDVNTGTQTFNLDFTFENCDLDSLMIVAGFDCLDYPADRLEIISGGWPCDLDTLWLYSKPLPGSIAQAVIQAPDLVEPCEEFTYEVQVDNNGEAILYEPNFSVFMPYSAGLDIIPGTEMACYPCDPFSPTFNYNIFAPTQTIVTTLGIQYIWDLEVLIPEINVDGLPGVLEPDVTKRTLRVMFDAETNCDFYGGDFPRFTSGGMSACGEKSESVIQTGEAVVIIGTSFGYAGLVDIEMVEPNSGPVNACGGTGTIANSVQFPVVTSGIDSLMIAMPTGTSYVPGSVFFDDPTQVTSTTPVINWVNGIQEVIFRARAGIPAFASINYTLDFQVDPELIPCSIESQPFRGSVFNNDEIICKGVPCSIRIITGSDETEATFEKYEYEITDYSINVPCGATQVEITDFTVQNTGDYPVTTGTDIDIYFDADGSGDVTAGDVIIGSLSDASTIPVGGSIVLSGTFPIDPTQSCPLIADFSSCSCVEAESLDGVNYENAGSEVTICNNDPINLGCGENVAGFSYFWSGLNGAPVSALDDRYDPNSGFTYTNTNTSADTLDYVLTTTFGDCMSFDTMRVIVLPTIKDVGAMQRICPGYTVTLNGPQGFTNYSWSPGTDLSSTTSPQPVLTTDANVPTTYALTYTNADGCLQEYEEMIGPGFNCNDIELGKVVDLAEAAVGDNLTYTIEIINKGPLPASGVQVTDLIPSELLYVSHDPLVYAYDPLTGIWDIGVMAVDDTLYLDITASVQEVGLAYNCAEVSAMDNTDIDSTPGNGILNEDDKGTACTTIPTIVACDHEPPTITAPPSAAYQWYIDGTPIAGATSPDYIVDFHTFSSVMGTHRYSPYPDGSCSYVVTINPCSADLSVEKTVSTNIVVIGDQITYTIDVTNDGPTDATNVQLQDLIPAGIDYVSNSTSTGFYTDPTGIWTIPFIGVGDTETLEITVGITASGTDITNIAEIDASDQPDIDSEPDNDNGDQSEDDEDATTITSVPTANIGNFVWHDVDQDGRQDAGEVPIPNALVTLYDANTNMVIGTMQTDAGGMYLFTDLPAGDYYLTFDISGTGSFSSFVATTQDNYADSADSDVSGVGRTNNFSFDPINGDDLTYDAGYHQECAPPSVEVSGN